MRQWLGAVLVLFFGLGPLTAVLPASDDARLPPCCRRHGAHHCAMAARMEAMMAQDTTPGFTAPSTCPLYPGATIALLAPAYALAPAPAPLPALDAVAQAWVSGQAARIADPVRSHGGRGPPAPSSI